MEKAKKTCHWLCVDPVSRTIYDMIVEKIDKLTYRRKCRHSAAFARLSRALNE